MRVRALQPPLDVGHRRGICRGRLLVERRACMPRTAGRAPVRTRRTIARTRLRPLGCSRASPRSRRADRPTVSPEATRKCPCVVVVDRVKFAWAHGRGEHGDASAPGSDELIRPRPRVRVLGLSGPAAVAGVGVVRSPSAPAMPAGERPNHRNLSAAAPGRSLPDIRTARKRTLECRSTSDSDETGGELAASPKAQSAASSASAPDVESSRAPARDFGARDGAYGIGQRSEVAAGS